MKNTAFDTNNVKHCCETKLRIHFREGKEFNGWVTINNKKFSRITVPKGRKDIFPKTYKSMANQLKLTTDQFDDLLECPLNWEQYVEIAKKISQI
jgi:hypothetical protein